MFKNFGKTIQNILVSLFPHIPSAASCENTQPLTCDIHLSEREGKVTVANSLHHIRYLSPGRDLGVESSQPSIHHLHHCLTVTTHLMSCGVSHQWYNDITVICMYSRQKLLLVQYEKESTVVCEVQKERTEVPRTSAHYSPHNYSFKAYNFYSFVVHLNVEGEALYLSFSNVDIT